MSCLSVHLGQDGRTALCDTFAAARSSIDAEFYSIADPAVLSALNAAAMRGVSVRVTIEGDPHRYSSRGTREPADATLRAAFDRRVDVVISHAPRPLVHGKAAVVDRREAVIATANPTETGFGSPGEAVIVDGDTDDAHAVLAKIQQASTGSQPSSGLRQALTSLFSTREDMRIASEDLADWRVVAALIGRAHDGRHDRVLVGARPSRASKRRLGMLVRAGVDVRCPVDGYMHEKFVDGGTRLYVGSANLTRNGIDESHEVGIVADAIDFDDGGRALRSDFDLQWATARRVLHG